MTSSHEAGCRERSYSMVTMPPSPGGWNPIPFKLEGQGTHGECVPVSNAIRLRGIRPKTSFMALGNPYGGVTIDDSGNLYGTAATGGGGSGAECLGVSCGVIFELTPPDNTGGDWMERILYVFTGGNDGATPESPLLLDKQGNLYGTALNGGLGTCKSPYALGCGSAFELIPPNMSGGTWTEITLHTFTGAQTDQGLPYSGLTFGKGGKLYGASAGRVGAEPEQNGTIFQIIP